MTVILTQSRHDNFVTAFHNNIKNSPKKVTLRLLDISGASNNSFESFTGTSNSPTIKEVILPCFYKKNELEYDDSFVGFSNLISGRVYLSPEQLQNSLGTFRLDAREVIFVLDGTEFTCSKVYFLEELYDKPIAVEFTLKDKLRG